MDNFCQTSQLHLSTTSNMSEETKTVPISTSSGQRSAAIINVANFLKDNKILKQRTGLLNNTEDVEFFKFKRLTRALLSEEYKKKQANPKNELLPIETEEDVGRAFIQLIQSQFIIPVDKLHYAEIKQIKGWKPNRTKPTLRPSKKASLDPHRYFVWTYNKPNPFILLYSVLTIIGVFTVILFPLWPNFMKLGVWYLSMGLLGLLGLFFVVAIVRLIIYIVTLVALPRAFWLYPNLFEDCSVIESFRPLYAWEEPKGSKKSKKSKKLKPELAEGATANGATASGAQTSDGQAVKRKVTLEEVADE